MAKVLRAWDTEVHVGSGYLRSVNPLLPDTWLVAQAWADYNKEGFVAGGIKVPMTPVTSRYYKSKPEDGWFKEVLTGCDILTGANIKFDLMVALYNHPKNYEAYREWVNAGGRIWDILQAEFILEGMTQESMYLGLEQVAVRYGGNTKLDQVKAMWEQGVQTEDIPKDLLLEYLCGAYTEDTCEHGDIGNTLLAALGQIKQARQEGRYPWMKVEMLALQATTEMEINGTKIDWGKAEEARKRAEERLEAAKAVVVQAIPEEAKESFSWASWQDRSRLLFGGEKIIQVKGWYNKDGELREELWPEGQQAYVQKEEVRPVLDETGNPVIIASGKNKGNPKTKKVKVDDLTKPKGKLIDKVIQFPRRLTPPEGSESSIEGLYSTSSEFFDQLPEGDEIVEAIKEVVTWTKDIGTSYYSYDKYGNKKGGTWEATMPDGTIHAQFQHNTTVSGRLSSKSPNSQNYSKVGEIKKCLVSRYPEGVVTQSDFRSLENYVGLWLSGCPGYRQLFEENRDTHCSVAATWQGMDYEEFAKRYDEGDKWAKETRQTAKSINFAMGYGGGVKKLAYMTKLPEEEVQAIMDANKRVFHGYWDFQDKVYETIQTNVTYTGDLLRHPEDPTKLYKAGYGVWEGPYGLKWSYPLTPSPKFVLDRSGVTENVSPTQAKNLHIQGTGGSAMKAALAVQFLTLMAQPKLSRIKMVATVHDASYWDAPKELAGTAADLQQVTMEACNDVLTKVGLDVMIRVPAVTTYGPCWKELEGDTTVDPDTPRCQAIRDWVTTRILPEVFK